MTDLTETVGGKCDVCEHHQNQHSSPDGCSACDCQSRGLQ